MLQPSPLNEKVLREKRKKLKETFDRVMRLYVSIYMACGRLTAKFIYRTPLLQHNDDPELWAELKRKEVEYERRRNKKVQYFESVRHAQTVQIDDIPLPQMGDQPIMPPPRQNIDINPATNNLLARPTLPNPNSFVDLQIPPDFRGAKPTIGPTEVSVESKDTADDSLNEKSTKNIAGCPPGPPPNLRDLHDLDSDYESDEDERETTENSNKGNPQKDMTRAKANFDTRNSEKDSDEEDVREPTSVQKRILAIAGQKFDDFMKELENVRKKKDVDSEQSSTKYKEKSDTINESTNSSHSHGFDSEFTRSKQSEANEPPHEAERKQENVLFKPQPMPPIRNTLIPPPMKIPNPPPPPMGVPPAMMFRPPPMRPGLQSLGIRMPPGMSGLPRLRMPPGPPPGIPPARMSHPPFNKPLHPNVVASMQKPVKDTKGMTTISAKPQIRNLSADVTRFVPSTLRVKREDKKVPKKSITPYSRHQSEQTAKAAGTTKDDAYMQFMQEMQGLL